MRKAKVTKEKIIEKAIELFSYKGIDAVSMNEIASSLKITKPVLYYYFKNKDEMIKYAFSLRAKEISNIFGTLENIDDLEKLIKVLIQKHYDFFSKNDSNIRCFFKIIDSDNRGYLVNMANEMIEKNRSYIKEKVEEIKRKDLKYKDVDTNLVVVFVSSVISYLLMERKMKRKIDLNLLYKMVNVLVKGLVVVMIFVSSVVSAEYSFTIDEAINTAFEKNISVLNAYTSEKIYREKINEYYGGVYPQISLSAGYTRNIDKPLAFFGQGKVEMGKDNSYSMSIDMYQILWAGGKVDTGIQMAKIYKDVSEENTKLTKNLIKKSVKSLFYSILYTKELVNINKEVLDLAKKHLQTTQERYKEGLSSDLDVLRQKVEVSNSEPRLIKAENLYRTGLLNLKNLLGLNFDDDMKIIGDFNCGSNNYNFDELYKKALLNRPDYRLSVLNKKMSEKQVQLESSAHWPTISAFATKQFSGVSDSGFPDEKWRGWSFLAGVKFSMPVFNGFSVVSRVKQAKYNLEIAERNVDDTSRKIKIELQQSLFDIEEASKRIESQKTSVENAKKMLETTEVRFKEGLSSQLELNDATLAYNSARLNYAQALYDFCVANVNLEYIVGGEK
jgi:outer membrane protein TolC/AcrR family transcriptional regulator